MSPKIAIANKAKTNRISYGIIISTEKLQTMTLVATVWDPCTHCDKQN